MLIINIVRDPQNITSKDEFTLTFTREDLNRGGFCTSIMKNIFYIDVQYLAKEHNNPVRRIS